MTTIHIGSPGITGSSITSIGAGGVAVSGGAAPLLRLIWSDEFTTPRAAGAVNGTANDGIGSKTRTVVDTVSHMTIANGVLDFGGGAAAAGNPGLWYDAHTRAAGLIIVAQMQIEDSWANKICGFGWDSNQSTEMLDGFSFSNSLVMAVRDNGSSINVGTAPKMATSYRLLVALHPTAGAFYFVVGGEYQYPRLIWISDTATTATLYPIVLGRTALATWDYVRHYDGWLPTPLASDGFGSAFGATDGLGHGISSGIGAGGNGLAWTQQIGTWQTAAGVASASALAGGLAIATVPTTTANVLIAANLTRAGGNVGLVARYADANNHLLAYHDGTNAKVDQVLAGVTTNLVSAAATYTAGARLRLIPYGTEVQLFYGATRVGVSTGLDASLTATAHGLYTTDTGNTIDLFRSFAGGGGSGEYGGLSSFAEDPTVGIFAIGDSKTQSSTVAANHNDWPEYICKTLNDDGASPRHSEKPFRFGISGYTVAQMLTYCQTNLAAQWLTPNIIAINLGANDVQALPAEATLKASYVALIDLLRAKWPSVQIYLARVWRQSNPTECNTFATWIADIVATYPSGVHVGMDERVWLEGGDDGATYTTDGTHYSEPAQQVAADAWIASFGL